METKLAVPADGRRYLARCSIGRQMNRPWSTWILIAAPIAAVVLAASIWHRSHEPASLQPTAELARTAKQRPSSLLSRETSLRTVRDLALVDMDSSGRLFGVSFYDPVGLPDRGFAPRKLVNSDLRLLAPFPELERLDIAGTAITDAGLKHLKGLNEIERLNISSTAITGHGLRSLADMSQLRMLDLVDIAIDDSDLEFLSVFAQLQRLSISSPLVSDSGLAHLHKLGKLEGLYLGRLQVTDQGIRHLAKLPSLTHVTLDGTPISDGAVPHFAKLTQLRYLHLKRTTITSKGAADIQSALPSCTVNRDIAYP